MKAIHTEVVWMNAQQRGFILATLNKAKATLFQNKNNKNFLKIAITFNTLFFTFYGS